MSEIELKNNGKCTIYSVGPDELDSGDNYELGQEDFSLIEWIVYWYEIEPYAGSGTLVAKFTDGTYAMEHLGHCSCFGPIDEGIGADRFSIESILSDLESGLDDYDYKENTAILNKVKELIED